MTPYAKSGFSISATPSTLAVAQGVPASSTVTTAKSGRPQTISLSLTGLPADSSYAFNPAVIRSGDSSTLTIQTDSLAVDATYSVTVTGTVTVTTDQTSVYLTVGPTPTPTPTPTPRRH